VTITLFDALDALADERPHHEHECHEHDDVADETCPIASAVITAEGTE